MFSERSNAFRSRRLMVESLESRAMLAGNVTASVANGSLIVQGDDLSNGVAIEQTAANTFRVRTYHLGGTPTLLNGSTTNIQTFIGIVNDVNVSVLGSYDEVSIQKLDGTTANIPRNLNVDGGLAEDNVHLEVNVGSPTRGGYLTVKNAWTNMLNSSAQKNITLSGRYTTLTNVTAGGNVTLEGTNAGDHFNMDNVKASNLRVRTGPGRDDVRLASKPQIAGDVSIFMGDGEDFVRIGSLSATTLNIELGLPDSGTPSAGGLISVFGQSNIQQGVVINGSAGTDNTTIDGLHAGGTVAVKLEAGDDRLNISNTSAPKAVLVGGDGFDKLFLGEGNAFDELEQTGFE